MKSTAFVRVSSAALILSLSILTQSGQGSDWASDLFESRSHNFGTVARAAKTEHVFEFENRTDREIRISHVRASCGCTTPIVPQKSIPAGEKGQVVARFNTASFVGQRGATLTVVFDRPNYREVQLRVDGYVRRDVVCNPGSLDFGKTDQAQSVTREIDIQYAGRNDWAINEIQSDVPGLELELKETRRQGGRVGYSLVATWNAQATGYLQSNVVLQTNDRLRPTIPLSVTGQSVSTLQISPANLYLGEVAPGETVQKRVIVRANDEFQLTGVRCEDQRVQCEYKEDAKSIQMIELTFVANDQPGPFQMEVIVETNASQNATARLVVSGMINSTATSPE